VSTNDLFGPTNDLSEKVGSGLRSQVQFFFCGDNEPFNVIDERHGFDAGDSSVALEYLKT